MSVKKVTYSLPALKTLLAAKNSCVFCIENCHRSILLLPAQLSDLRNSVKEYLSSKITTCDPELQGIILSHKNVKIIDSVQLNDDGNYRLDYIADTYVFKPAVGSLLTGVVNKKCVDHLGVLIHSVFNATIPRPRLNNECPKLWAGNDVQIGQQVTFQVSKVNFGSRLPYIKGQLVGIEEHYFEDGDSGIGGHESTEESTFRSVCDHPLDGNEKIKKKSKKKKKQSGVIENVNINSNLSDIESLLLNEVISNGSSAFAANNSSMCISPDPPSSCKKQKRVSCHDLDSSSMISLSNQLSILEDDPPKPKKKKLSDGSIDKYLKMLKHEEKEHLQKKLFQTGSSSEAESRNVHCDNKVLDIQSTIDDLMSLATETPHTTKKKKKKSSLSIDNTAFDSRAVVSPPHSNVSEVIHEPLLEKKRKKKRHTESFDSGPCLRNTSGFPESSPSADLPVILDYNSDKSHKKQKHSKSFDKITAVVGVPCDKNPLRCSEILPTSDLPIISSDCNSEKKKKKKRSKLFDEIPVVVDSPCAENNLRFYETFPSSDSSPVSKCNSDIKHKKEKNALISHNNIEPEIVSYIPSLPVEKTFQEHKKKEKKKKKSNTGINFLQMENDCIAEMLSSVHSDVGTESHYSSVERKKKKKIHMQS